MSFATASNGKIIDLDTGLFYNTDGTLVTSINPNQSTQTQKPTGLTDMNEGWKKYADESIAKFQISFNSTTPLRHTFKLKTATPETMTRLTTSGEWTIALKNNKLFAFNEHGSIIEAVGSLISVDGKAWLYKNGSLWSGVLEKVTTEREEYNQKQNERTEKKNAFIHKNELKIQKIRQAYEKQLENL